jgi:hypothetical protein
MISSKYSVPCLVFLALVLGLATTSQAQVKFLNEYDLKSTTSFPEGLAFDPLSRNFYPTAVFGAQITQVPADGVTPETVFFTETANPRISFSGAKVDFIRRILWVCGVDVQTNPFPVSTVYGIKILPDNQPGQLVHKIPLAGPSFCNDIALDFRGDIFATDSIQPNIYKVHPEDDSFEIFATSPLFAAQGGPFGLNGIQVTPDQNHIITVTSFPPQVLSLRINDPANVQQVALSGDPLTDPNPPLAFTAPDGLIFVFQKAYIVQNGAVQQLTFTDHDFLHATLKNVLLPQGLTSATEAFGQLFVIDSQVVPFVDLGLPAVLPFKILRVDLELFE